MAHRYEYYYRQSSALLESKITECSLVPPDGIHTLHTIEKLKSKFRICDIPLHVVTDLTSVKVSQY